MTAVDFTKPDNSSDTAQVWGMITNALNHILTATYTSDANIPTGAIRTNPSTFDIEAWNGTAWVVKDYHHPAGKIDMFGGSSAPSGWLLCDGSAVSRSTYAALFTAIGSTYGAGDGSTTFNVPDLRGRSPYGANPGVTALGASDAVALASRTPGHSHANPAHYHGIGTGADLNINSSGDHTHPIQARPADGTSTGSFFPAAVHTTQGVQSQTTDSAAHPHATAAFAGRIGLVTGGVDGNTAQTTSVNNSGYAAVNFIIKT